MKPKTIREVLEMYIAEVVMDSSMGTPDFIDQALQSIKEIMEVCVEKSAEEAFRSYYVPLYSKDKPISEMTSTEQGLYKNTLVIANMIHQQTLENMRRGM